jgi:dolichol-phosphate mannosyltransferase
MSVSRIPEVSGPVLSVVVPCYNEEEVIAVTYRELSITLQRLVPDYEIIFVDDGSRDGTLPILRDLARGDARTRVVAFARNFGHSSAVSAGLDFCSGDAVVLIDADLQDPPEVIEQMLQEWAAGADVVYGVRTERAGETWFKRRTASMFYRALNKMSDTPIPLDTGDFRLMDRRVVDVLRAMPEHDRFIRGMVSWVGFRQVPVAYRRHARAAGQTKYPFRKMIRFAVTGILSFSSAPLRLATWAGFFAALVAISGIGYALASKMIWKTAVPGWAATFVAVMFVSGVQLICTGIIGEYLARVYMQSKGRPLYVVAAAEGFGAANHAFSTNGRGVVPTDSTRANRLALLGNR